MTSRSRAPRLDVVLFSKTGSGKSSLANALTGSKHFAGSGSSGMASDTTHCKCLVKAMREYFLTVVDTPGSMDTKDEQSALLEICQAITQCPDGFDVVLLVLRLDVRYTKEEIMASELLKTMFGEDIFKHVIVIFTHGDDVDNDEQQFNERINMARSNLTSPSSQFFDSLLKKCGERYFMIDTGKRSSPDVQQNQVDTIINAVFSLSLERKSKFTNKYFENARKYLTEEKSKPGLSVKKSEDMCEADQEVDATGVKVEFKVAERLAKDVKNPCFPSDAMVLTPLGRVRLSELTVGQPVLSLQDGRPVFSPVFMWGHRDEAAWSSDFVTVSTASAQLTLSSGHLLFVSAESAAQPDRLSAVPARDVQPGLSLQLLDGDVRLRLESVVAVQRGVTRRGLLAPFTLNGCIAVDGVLASCYIDCLPHDLSHALLAPVRALWLVAPSVADAFNRVGWRDSDGMSGWVRLACDHLLPTLRRFRVKDSSELVKRIQENELL